MTITQIAERLEAIEKCACLGEAEHMQLQLYKTFITAIATGQIHDVPIHTVPMKLRIQADLCYTAMSIVNEKRPDES